MRCRLKAVAQTTVYLPNYGGQSFNDTRPKGSCEGAHPGVWAGLWYVTVLHISLSLVGIDSGVIVIWGLISGKLNGLTAIFLVTTLLTSISDFLFPVDHCCLRALPNLAD
jgi:hypothetical protein